MERIDETERLFAGGGEVGALMRTTDWRATPLGPPESWPQSLRTVVRIMLTSRYAMWIGLIGGGLLGSMLWRRLEPQSDVDDL